MDEDWTNTTDPKERKRIQNRVAQRAHREKLRSRIRQLEDQLENAQNGASKGSQQSASYEDALTFAMPGILPTPHSEPISDRSRTSSADISTSGDHASKLLLGSEISIEPTFNPLQHGSGTVAQLDPISWAPTEDQHMDIDWLLTDSGALRTMMDRPPGGSPIMGGQEISQRSQSPPITSSTLHPPDRARNGRRSSHPVRKPKAMLTPQKLQTSKQVLPSISDATSSERLGLLEGCGRRLGFSNLTEALSVYYTSDLGDNQSAISSHEQSLNRVRQLPNFLSSIREHSKQWPKWERTNYVRETLRSAEDFYAEECKLARTKLQDQATTSLTAKNSQGDQTAQITRMLQQEIPDTWALISSIILHTRMPGESHQSQIILMVMMLLCCRDQDPATALGLCQKYLS